MQAKLIKTIVGFGPTVPRGTIVTVLSKQVDSFGRISHTCFVAEGQGSIIVFPKELEFTPEETN